MSGHTPGPWDVDPKRRLRVRAANDITIAACGCDSTVSTEWHANARLIAAAPDLLKVLLDVRKLISEAGLTGFNCHDGDWAERLFSSQQVTSAAINKAQGKPT